MNDIAIKVENLGKKYVINHEAGKSDDNFREVIIGNAKNLFNKLNPFSPSIKKEKEHTKEEFWALNDVNFEIKKGDKVGVIGRNGAGKSTLLKVLSRITEPTTGKIHINGRIASLLEVGTGFHPELTGRENIYLNGAILGMSRKEIKAKFDEIVAFAEVDKFLDTPVKRYSSGMYVRLAFSVAAHLEPEILIVDEVLAVGDVAFQKKCLGKMDEVSKEGRTILFVSHNIAAINQLTNKAILLADGKIKSIGDTEKVVESYKEIGANNITNSIFNISTDDPNITVASLEMRNEDVGYKKPLVFFVNIKILKKAYDLSFRIGIYNSLGSRLLTAKNLLVDLEKGEFKYIMSIEEHSLPPGDYQISLGMTVRESRIFYKEDLIAFSISDAEVNDPLLVPYLKSNRDKIGAFYNLKTYLD